MYESFKACSLLEAWTLRRDTLQEKLIRNVRRSNLVSQYKVLLKQCYRDVSDSEEQGVRAWPHKTLEEARGRLLRKRMLTTLEDVTLTWGFPALAFFRLGSRQASQNPEGFHFPSDCEIARPPSPQLCLAIVVLQYCVTSSYPPRCQSLSCQSMTFPRKHNY